MYESIEEILEDRSHLVNRMKELHNANPSGFDARTQKEYDKLNRDQQELADKAERIEKRQRADAELAAMQSRSGLLHSSSPIIVKGQSALEHFRGDPVAPGVTMGGLMKGMLGGKMRPEIRNALTEGSDAAGGYTVPEVLLGQFIDALRAKTRAFQAGASIVPLSTNSTTIAKLESDPTFAWRAEGAAVSESDPTFGAVTLAPKSLAVIFKASNEVLMDSVNIEDMLFTGLVNAAAVAVDQAILNGRNPADSPINTNQPIGVLHTSGINTVDMSSASPNNGAAFTNYDPFIDALFALESDNANAPTAAIMHPRTDRDLLKLKDADDHVLMPPEKVWRDNLPYLTTTSMPINETVGSSSDASSILIGDFSQVIVGIRQDFQLEVLRELYRANLQTGFIAHLRIDVAVTRPQHFVRIQGITPS